jgi:hypothetical protein
MTRSLLFQDDPQFTMPPGCGLCDRVEVPVSLRKNGRIYRFVLRDKVVVEDLLMVGVKAAAFAISEGEAYAGTPPSRAIRDTLIKQDVVI